MNSQLFGRGKGVKGDIKEAEGGGGERRSKVILKKQGEERGKGVKDDIKEAGGGGSGGQREVILKKRSVSAFVRKPVRSLATS